MNNVRMINARKYLYRFDQILCEMAEKMLSVEIINNITIDFIRCMIPHHQAAIYMCENLLNFINYTPLQEIARNIIKTQTKGIEQMRIILKTTKGYNNYPKNVKCYMEKYEEITNDMIYKMKNSLRSQNINLNFTYEMIPHHEGAVKMCENLLNYSIDPRLKYVVEDIIQEQKRGIKELEKIQQLLSNRR